MKKAILKGRISIILAVIFGAVYVLPAFAANFWMSVTPGNQITNGYPAVWNVIMGKEPGCPETNLKFREYFGDGVRVSVTNVAACTYVTTIHAYSNNGTYTQTWYAGQGSNAYIKMNFTTTVIEN